MPDNPVSTIDPSGSGAKGMMGDSWAFTKALGGGAWSGAKSTADGLWSLAKGGVRLVTDRQARSDAWAATKRVAAAAKDYGKASVQDPAKPFRDARDGALSVYTAVDAARQKAASEGKSAEFWGGAIGRGAFEVGTLLIPIGAATKAGKLGELAKAAELATGVGKEVKAAEVVAETVSAADKVKAIAKAPALVAEDAAVSALKECPLKKAAAEAAAATEKALDEMLEKAPAAKKEIDGVADLVAHEHGGVVAKTELKKRATALDKINREYNGTASGIKDLARNTVIVDAGKEEAALASLRKLRPDIAGKDIKIAKAAEDPLGYSGIKVTMKTESGLVAETQINSPEMIFAKESKQNAINILGKEKYEEIASRPGIPPGGRGHVLYERYRVLDKGSEEAKAIAAESRAYYDAFRR